MASIPAADPDNDELRRSLPALSHRYRTHLAAMRRPPDEAATIERMRKRIASTRVRIERLEHQAASLIAEITGLEDEVHGREKALALLLQTVVGRIERTHADAWSPVPIHGFRLWLMRNGELWGARTRWTEARFTARCSAAPGPVPHHDGPCGRLGCGVYATKELAPLLAMHLRPDHHSYVAALVGLGGTVIEHVRGYRGATAAVLAVYAVWPDRTMATSDPTRIADLFAACDRIPSSWCLRRGEDADPLPDLAAYLTNHMEEHTRWI